VLLVLPVLPTALVFFCIRITVWFRPITTYFEIRKRTYPSFAEFVTSRLSGVPFEFLTVPETADLGVEDDQSVEYGVRQCQEMSIILQRLINDGNLLSLHK